MARKVYVICLPRHAVRTRRTTIASHAGAVLQLPEELLRPEIDTGGARRPRGSGMYLSACFNEKTSNTQVFRPPRLEAVYVATSNYSLVLVHASRDIQLSRGETHAKK